MTGATPPVIATTPSSFPPATDRAPRQPPRQQEAANNKLVSERLRGRRFGKKLVAAVLEKVRTALATMPLPKLSTRGRSLMRHSLPLSSLLPLGGSGRSFRVDPRFGNVAGQFSLGEGLLILEIQEGLLTFLVTCCRSILHDISADDLTSERLPVQPPLLHLKTETETDDFTSLAIMEEEANTSRPSGASGSHRGLQECPGLSPWFTLYRSYYMLAQPPDVFLCRRYSVN